MSDGRGTVVFGDLHPNPHIRAFTDEPQERQLENLESAPLEHACLYPSAQHLATVVGETDYRDRPFTRELAGQLEFRSFDLSVLEIYRNDPRYHYDNDDIRGQICVTDEFYESDQMHEKDQILLETFGFSYDDQMNRAVAVFLIHREPLWLRALRNTGTQTPMEAPRTTSSRMTLKSWILGDWDEKYLNLQCFHRGTENHQLYVQCHE